ncbi:hypothetical protein DGG96_16795 [Legionella qingyii]|uniref:Uncharacterized protein n=1 Tax=Legionella qingyii TaxID=2184757 RepID=A0A317TY11_9GAMM|nr:hypothetical protein DGG96_16795 [Legionella qingyii]
MGITVNFKSFGCGLTNPVGVDVHLGLSSLVIILLLLVLKIEEDFEIGVRTIIKVVVAMKTPLLFSVGVHCETHN